MRHGYDISRWPIDSQVVFLIYLLCTCLSSKFKNFNFEYILLEKNSILILIRSKSGNIPYSKFFDWNVRKDQSFRENIQKAETSGTITSDSSYIWPRMTVECNEFLALTPRLIHKFDRRKQKHIKGIN